MIKIRQQAGISIISTIFIMIVLGFLGIYMSSLNTFQHTGTSLNLQSQRAYYAAESGLQWFAWYSINNNTCPVAGTNFTIGNFTVEVDSCTTTAVTEGTKNYNVFDVELTASTTGTSLGDSAFSSRTLSGRIIGPVS